MSEDLGRYGIEYQLLESLGGHRKESLPDSPNFGLKDEAFRNYADHMLGDEFREGADQLLEIAENMAVAIMYAEKSFHDCHRKLTSDYLVAGGAVVQHILADRKLESHKLSETVKVQDGELTYPESHPLFD